MHFFWMSFSAFRTHPRIWKTSLHCPDHGLEIAKEYFRTTEPDLAAVKASRPDQSDCFFGPNVIELCRLADMTFLGLHGGEGENGKLQATFRSARASATPARTRWAVLLPWTKDVTKQ